MQHMSKGRKRMHVGEIIDFCFFVVVFFFLIYAFFPQNMHSKNSEFTKNVFFQVWVSSHIFPIIPTVTMNKVIPLCLLPYMFCHGPCRRLKAMALAPPNSTCLFTRLKESSLVPVGFLTAQFLQKKQFMKPLFFQGKLCGASLYYLPG